MKKKIVFLSIGAAAVIAGGLLVYTYLPAKSSIVAAVPLNTATVTTGDIVVSVSGAGSVTAPNTGKVKTKDAGKVSKVLVEEGAVVKKGQTLITFEGEDLSDNLKQENNNLANLQIDLEDKQEQYKKLAVAGASEDDLTSAKRGIEKAKTDIETQKDKIASVEEDMVPPDPLTAPIDGTVTAVNIDDGEKAMDGSELITITDYAHLSAVVQVDELDIPSVEIGMPATITLDALPDTELQGKVTAIANEGTSSNGVSLFDVTVGLTASKGARVGMSAEVSITTDEKKGVLTVPIEAVRQRGGNYTVAVPSVAAVAGSASNGSGQTPTSSIGTDGKDGTDAPGSASGGEASGTRTGTGFSGGTGTRSSGAKPKGTADSSEKAAAQRIVTIEVGLHNETSFEIKSGLNEGDKVIIPTVTSTGNSTAAQQFQGDSGFGVFGDMNSGTGGFSSGERNGSGFSGGTKSGTGNKGSSGSGTGSKGGGQ